MDALYAGWLLSALGAAIVVVAAWLLFPRGREPGLGRAALLFCVVALLVPFLGLALGVLAGPLTLLPPALFALAEAFLAAAIPEEAFKGAVVWWLVFHGRRVRLVQDGAFYGVIAGMGFALVENMAYILQAEHFAAAGDQLAFVRTLMSAPGHASFSAILGHHLALAALAGGPGSAAGRGLMLRGLTIAAACHGGFNLALLLGPIMAAPWLAVAALPIFMGSVVYAFVCLERARRLDDRRLQARNQS